MTLPRAAATFITLWLGALSAGSTPASDWPQFRGPQRNGTADDVGLLAAWAEGRPEELWRRAIGGGFSSVAVAGQRLITMAKEPEGEVVLCIDAASGETLWRASLGKSGEAFPEDGPRSTPTVADGRVYAVSSQGKLAALRVEDGSVIWTKDLTEWGPVPRFGYSVSPLVDGGLVVLETGKPGESPGVIALDRKTGELRWAALEGPAGYSSPIVVELAGVRQYVFFRGAGREIVALSTEGNVLWRHTTNGQTVITSPIFVAPDRFFVATSDDAFGGLMLRVTDHEGEFLVEQAWAERLMRNHFNSSVLVDGYLYGFDNATFRCLDATNGERRWAKRGLGKGSLVAAGDLLFVLADDGTLVLVRATPEAYMEAGRVRAMEGRAWTAPALAEGRLYLRDSDELVGFDLRGKAEAVATLGASTSVESAEVQGRTIPADLTLAAVLDRYRAARGGVESWRKLKTLRLRGDYAAFSEDSHFELIRKRGDLYRLDFELLGGPAIRARDAEGPWWQHALLRPEAGRVGEGPYKKQLERESLFEPLLLDHASHGARVALIGPGDVDGVATVDLEVTLAYGGKESWHLDSRTFLEVAVDSEVHDLTQGPQPMHRRAFFTDFRRVDGVVLPFRIELEFGARLETLTVTEVFLNAQIDETRFEAPRGG